MKIISLFDGISGAQQALNRAGIKYSAYYASEVDKYAIKITQKNYPDTIQLGDVRNVVIDQHFDYLFGGSPCQSFSFAGKQKGMSTKCEKKILSLQQYLELKAEGFEFEGQSYLFWEFIRILEECRKFNPNIKFLLENVIMSQEWEWVITKAVGVHPIEINSALVSAQNRRRLYWCNIGLKPTGLFGDLESIIQQPKDKGILLKDILETVVDDKYYLSEKLVNTLFHTRSGTNDQFKEATTKDVTQNGNSLTARYYKMGRQDNYLDDKVIQLNPSTESNGRQPYQQNRVYDSNGISPALCANKADLLIQSCDYRSDEGFRFRQDGKTPTLLARAREDMYRAPMVRVQGVTFLPNGDIRPHQGDERKSGVSEFGTINSIDNKSVTVTATHEPKIYETIPTDMVKSNILTTDGYLATGKRKRDENGKAQLTSMNERRIRRLTPLECERLQTVADGYTEGISETQRYKSLGNGWTIDVIAHILSYA